MITHNTMELMVPTPIILDNSYTRMPCRSGRIVSQPNRSCIWEAIPMEYEINPIDYNESMSDMDAHL